MTRPVLYGYWEGTRLSLLSLLKVSEGIFENVSQDEHWGQGPRSEAHRSSCVFLRGCGRALCITEGHYLWVTLAKDEHSVTQFMHL